MVLPVQHYDNTKIYNVSGYNTAKLPEWLINKHKKRLKRDADFGKRIDLIQDFEFPEASNRLMLTQDGQSIVATGIYKPQIRVFDLNHLSLKFERHTNAETRSFVLLEDDWTKLALLQSDRTVEFHTQAGLHYSTRIPKAGRELLYDKVSADLLICGSSSEIYRLNLDQGRFLAPLETGINGLRHFSSVDSIEQSSQHRLLAIGGDGGFVMLCDLRHRKPVGRLPLPRNPIVNSTSVSTMKFFPDGLNLAVGLHSGSVFIYDIRSPDPILEKEHQYDLPIKKIDYHESSHQVVSADAKIVKVWDRVSGQLMATIEPPSQLNDLCIQQKTGIFLMANEGPQMQSFFIPALGPAPKWCSFLDNITEEMEESPQPTVYDNFKFLRREDLSSLCLSHLIGTNILKPYMHGFFIDFRLYEKAKAIANPFAYEEYKKKLVKDKLAKESSTRITRKNLPKVNSELAERLQSSSKDPSCSALVDSRFTELFSNADFEIDHESKEFRRLNPSLTPAKTTADTKKITQISTTNKHPVSDDEDVDSDDEEYGIRR